MRSHIVVGLAVLVLPIAVSFGCGDLAEATGDRAFDWTISKAPERTATPDRVSVILEHPDMAVLMGRAKVTASADRFRAHAVVYPREGAPIDLWGLWDTWGNFSAQGGAYYLAGTVGAGVAHISSGGARAIKLQPAAFGSPFTPGVFSPVAPHIEKDCAPRRVFCPVNM